jgi:hypothetical protein
MFGDRILKDCFAVGGDLMPGSCVGDGGGVARVDIENQNSLSHKRSDKGLRTETDRELISPLNHDVLVISAVQFGECGKA